MWNTFIRRAGVAVLALQVLVPLNAVAETDPPSQAGAITLDQAVTQALAHNPDLKAFGYQLEIDRGYSEQAGLAPNPELVLTLEDALGSGDYQGFDNAETTLSIGWVFERNIREHRVSAALAAETLTAADIEILRVDTAAETARRFLQVMNHQARRATATAALALAEATVQAVQERVDVGLAPDADLARARAELSYTRLLLEDNEHELLSSRHLLAAQWGLTSPDFERAGGDPYTLPAILPFQELQQLARQNPEINRYLARQRLDEAQLELAEAQKRPSWRGSLGMRRYESVNDMAFVTGVTVPLALNNRNQGNIAAARADLDQTLAETEAARVSIEAALFEFHQALQHSVHRATTLRDEVLPRVEAALKETQAAYERGLYSYFDLQIVQSELIEARNALIDASTDVHKNVIEIERLTGVRFAQPGESS